MTDWNNYNMRKWGASIRQNILEAYRESYVRGVALLVEEQILEDLVNSIDTKKMAKG